MPKATQPIKQWSQGSKPDSRDPEAQKHAAGRSTQLPLLDKPRQKALGLWSERHLHLNLALAFVGCVNTDKEPPLLRPVCSSGEWG